MLLIRRGFAGEKTLKSKITKQNKKERQFVTLCIGTTPG
jgi:hypothetical protein